MLVFLIPLKSPKVAKSWELTSKLFERCVKSVCNQTSSDYQVIVICHEKPKIEFNHPHLEYIEVEFKPPDLTIESKRLDREHKILRGLLHNRNSKRSCHIMAVDADDCVSKHLAQFVSRNSQANGWFLKKGYFYQENSKFIRIMRKGFDRYCGTSHIIREDLYDLPETLNEEELTKHIFNYYRHRQIQGTLAIKGIKLEPLPFAGAVYIQNGENIYLGVETKKNTIKLKSRLLRMKALLDNRLITKKIRHEFSLYNIN